MFFQYEDRAVADPSPFQCGCDGLVAEVLAIRRVAEYQVELTKASGLTKPRCIAAEDFCDAREIEFFDILAHKSAGGGTVIDEQAKTRAAGQGFYSECPGSGEEVQNPDVFEFKILDTML